MNYRDKIIFEIADAECEKIGRKIILALQKQTESKRQFGHKPRTVSILMKMEILFPIKNYQVILPASIFSRKPEAGQTVGYIITFTENILN
jgi:hypothetical protein